MENQFYQVVGSRRDYKGERYFKFNPAADSVVQVCFSTGDDKKGRANTVGVYLIHRLTFLTNYFAHNYVELITEKQYIKKLNQVIEKLS